MGGESGGESEGEVEGREGRKMGGERMRRVRERWDK